MFNYTFLVKSCELERIELSYFFDTITFDGSKVVKMWSSVLRVVLTFVDKISITSGHLECESTKTKQVIPLMGSAKST